MPRRSKDNRRGNNEGSIYQRKDGKWVGQVLLGYDPNTGKPKRAYHYSDRREEVSHWIAITLANHDDLRSQVDLEDLLVKDFLHSWLSNVKTSEVSSRTMELYFGDEKNHIVPQLGQYAICDITTSKLQTFLYELQAKKHLSKRTLEHIRGTLVQMFDYAIESNIMSTNPARNTKVPRPKHRVVEEDENKVIPIEQRMAVLKAMENEPIIRPIITMLMFTGMRIGEALALQWRHIDFPTNTISIRQAVTQEKEYDENGRVVKTTTVVGKTKTSSSTRTIRAPEVVMEALKQWIEYVCKIKNGKKLLEDKAFVFFSTRTYKMRTYSGFRSSYLHFLERHELNEFHINLHKYRHTYASMLLEQEVSPKAVQNLLGHTDVRTTLGIYTHVVPEIYDGVAALMNGVSKAMVEGTYKPKITSRQLDYRMKMLDPSLWENEGGQC